MDSLAGTESFYEADDNRRKRMLTIAAVALIAVILLGVWYAFAHSKGADTAAGGAGGAGAQNVPNVTVVIPGRVSVQAAIAANGTIAARREMPVGIAGEGGQVVRVLVEPGQWVGAGQTLAVIDRAVQSQQAASLAASIKVAQADADLAQAELERAQALVGRGFISKADMDRKRATRDAANARVRVSQAQYQEALARNGRLNIVAPAAGLVLTRQVEPGQVVGAGSGVLFRMARGGEMEMLAQLAEADLQRVKVGTRATITPVGTDLQIAGQVWQVSPIVNMDTRQGTVRIAVPYSAALRPGGFADARLVSGTEQAPLLPESAVQSGPDGNFVLVVGADDKIERKLVKVGTVTDGGVSIASGLTGNEKVVVLAGAFLNPGDKVKPVVQKSSQ
ncbi:MULTISPECIES: efflux RND transporter periplasmic adaptor subunit [unclassified Sphingopyxis]|uniref:efflux RND transporter periplasmic adaptor subunit n=1 Tax=unclassified Sphingopyxis TaxID=2614943 RepID=UPI00072FDFEA|nr:MULTISPECIES: efflux RND transporter periplasmic adaptor subunit [unclassified Sphingopyxis]KTE25150.1 secretion protein HylD [Sphingopyxis sp. H057]KTE53720.1 secretion protein HylD [Sphingopyxis sp. H073]KTE56311.1 secretion protein HylD [Sphingopyxis sp. H071]KTE67277.1 secretion protein HylD [Sphingopyxis sp. H100]KTE74718.1 secretion protein HylD [Sphingopyxis sp. H081]